MSRTDQVNWLRQIGENVYENHGYDTEGLTGKHLVSFYLDETDHIDLPERFDDADRRILTEYVQELLEGQEGRQNETSQANQGL